MPKRVVDGMTVDQLKDKTEQLFSLLLEARDALPAITTTAARLRGISLSLADRIEAAIEPWRVPEEGEKANG